MAVKRRAGAEAISVSSSDGSGSGGDFVWTPEREAELLEALICHKPAGLAKHFQMALLVSRLQGASADMKGVTAASVWRHLETLYNLEAADKVEKKVSETGFAGMSEGDFALPVKDFFAVMNDMKLADKIPDSETVRTPTVTTTTKRPTRSTPSTSKRRK